MQVNPLAVPGQTWNKPWRNGVNPSIGQFGEDTMSFNVLIVEDQPLVALNLQDTIEERKHPIGTACRIGPQWPKTRV